MFYEILAQVSLSFLWGPRLTGLHWSSTLKCIIFDMDIGVLIGLCTMCILCDDVTVLLLTACVMMVIDEYRFRRLL